MPSGSHRTQHACMRRGPGTLHGLASGCHPPATLPIQVQLLSLTLVLRWPCAHDLSHAFQLLAHGTHYSCPVPSCMEGQRGTLYYHVLCLTIGNT